MIMRDLGVARTVFLEIGVEDGSTGADGASDEEHVEAVDAEFHRGG